MKRENRKIVKQLGVLLYDLKIVKQLGALFLRSESYKPTSCFTVKKNSPFINKGAFGRNIQSVRKGRPRLRRPIPLHGYSRINARTKGTEK